MANFIIYSTDNGEILSTGYCPASMISKQKTMPGTEIMEDTANPETQYVDIETGTIRNRSDDDQAIWNYNKIKNKIPDLADINDIDDAALNARIEAFFYNQECASAWRIENYAVLRRAAYSSLYDRADASAKIASDDDVISAEGVEQLNNINAHDLAVKARFPKRIIKEETMDNG